jgi:hypothetical protein
LFVHLFVCFPFLSFYWSLFVPFGRKNIWYLLETAT